MYKKILGDFPKEFAVPQRIKICDNYSDIKKLVDTYNGIKNIYFSLYQCVGKINIDKIFWDFDDINAIEDVCKLHNYCIEKDIMHIMIFSGRGFHVYIFTTKGNNLKNPKQALWNAHDYLCRKLKLKLDIHVKGDIRRISRFINTYNLKSKRYCIPIAKEDIQFGFKYIENKAKEQNYELSYYGKNLFDISKFDCKNKNSDTNTMPEYNYDFKINDDITSRFLPCVQLWLHEPKRAINRNRYWFAVYCRDLCLPPKICDGLAKKYWGKTLDSSGRITKYKEFCNEKQINDAYIRKSDFFPNCTSLYAQGLCPGKCKYFKEKGSPCYK